MENLSNVSAYRQEASQIYVESLNEFKESNQLVGLDLEYYLGLVALLNYENLLLLGPLGSGKTEIARLSLQKAGSTQKNTANLNLGFGASRTSLTGSRIVSHEGGQEHIKSILGLLNNSTEYMFIDEFNRQNTDPLNALLEALGHTNKAGEDQKVRFPVPGDSDLILDNFRSVVATTNPADRSDGTVRLGEPLLSRFDTGIHFESKTEQMIKDLGRLMLPSRQLVPFTEEERIVLDQANLSLRQFQLNEQQNKSLSVKLNQLNNFWQKAFGTELSGRTIVKIVNKVQQLTYLNNNSEITNIHFPQYTNDQLAIITRTGSLLPASKMDDLKEELKIAA